MQALLRRVGRLVVVLAVVTLITFLLVSLLPGDVALELAGTDATEADLAAIRAELGLDRPLAIRYLHWVGGILTGDWGQSWRTGERVWDAIVQRVPASIARAEPVAPKTMSKPEARSPVRMPPTQWR